jgi:hypothetical protein
MRALVVLAVAGCGRIGFDAQAVQSTLTLAAPSEALADFPLLVVLDDTRANRAAMAADASDVRFFDGAGNLLVHEVEQVGTAGGPPLIAWVRVPMIAGATRLDVRYGYSDPPPPATGSVWSASYAGVWHLSDAGNPLDATTAHHDGTLIGPVVAPGFIAGGRSFSDAVPPQAIAIADAPDLGFTAITISAWIYQRTPTQNAYAAFVTRQEGAGPEDDFYLGEMGSTLYTEVTTTTGPAQGFTATGQTAPLGQWFHEAMTADGAFVDLYFDGAQVASVSMSGSMVRSTNHILFGADCNSSMPPCADSDPIDAILDEIRIESVARTPGWMAYDDAAMRDQVITYGPVE